MPTVPAYDQPRVQEQALPGVRVGASAPLEAFGGGESAARATAATQQAFGELGKIGEAEAHKANQTVNLANEGLLSSAHVQAQIEASKLRGKDAGAAADVALKSFDESTAQVLKGAGNEIQRTFIRQQAAQRRQSLDEFAHKHMFGEAQKYADETETGYRDQSQNAMAMNFSDDQRIGAEMKSQVNAFNQRAERLGIQVGGPAYKAEFNQWLSPGVKAVINARVDAGDTESAQEFFDAHKDSMTRDDLNHATSRIENGEVTNEGNAAWDKYKGLKLADGIPDLEAIEAKVRADSDLSPKRVEKVVQFVKARAGEFMANQNRADASNNREVMNSAIDARKKGLPLDQALKFADRGKDNFEQGVMTEAIRKVYAPTHDSDPGTFINIWEGVQNGQSSKTAIDQAMLQDRINVADWRKLREDYFKINSEGKDPLKKAGWERIKALGDEQFGSDKLAKESFMYEMHLLGEGKSPEEIYKLAQDKLKGDPNTGVFGFFRQQQWKTDLQRIDARNISWGTAYEKLGKPEVTAIGRGVLAKGAKTYSLSDIDAFAQSFGGIEKIQPGTPVHNAIQFLNSKGALVTPANVRAVLGMDSAQAATPAQVSQPPAPAAPSKPINQLNVNDYDSQDQYVAAMTALNPSMSQGDAMAQWAINKKAGSAETDKRKAEIKRRRDWYGRDQ